MSKRFSILAAVWIFAFAIALALDFSVAQWVHTTDIGRFVEGKWWAQILKEPGQFRFTAAVVIILVIAKQIHWKQAGFAIFAGAISGLHVFLKWIVGRTRPYKLPDGIQPRPFELHPFRDGLSGFFNQTNLSFPSGHVCPATALMVSMFLLWPRGSWIFVLLTVIVGTERVAENAHYCSDVVGALGFGVLTTSLLYRALAGWINRPDRGAIETVS